MAEGVETEAEVQDLLKLEIPLGQGFLLGTQAPVPAA
ncbi:MAG: EAL domain-containing protein [Chloroflexi bacterium]|nr:EAL domain-containing protein [Chloroflexota bacterium]